MTALLELQVVREDVDVLHVQRDGQDHLTEEDRITYAVELSFSKQQYPKLFAGSGITHFGSGSGQSGSGIGIGSGKCETEQERLLCKYGIACHFMKHFRGLIT
jgi:hypothetical protein